MTAAAFASSPRGHPREAIINTTQSWQAREKVLARPGCNLASIYSPAQFINQNKHSAGRSVANMLWFLCKGFQEHTTHAVVLSPQKAPLQANWASSWNAKTAETSANRAAASLVGKEHWLCHCHPPSPGQLHQHQARSCSSKPGPRC